MDFTGCGNTLNMQHPRVLQLVMDSLRYWVTEMHVDGFRFDLASALARELHEVDRLGAFFDIMRQDPVLSQVKLIAEPWDLGEGGYQVGNFPPGWAEWNDKYRDTMRALLEGRRRPDRRVRAAPHRLERSVRPQRPQPARQHQLRHRARRLHAARPGQLQRQAQRGERRGQSRRRRQQPVVELRRRGPDRRSRDQRAARAAEAQPARDAAAVAGRADAARRRRDRPHAARQQQRLLPGQRDLRGSTGTLPTTNARAARVRPAPDRVCAASIRCSGAAHFFQGRPLRGQRRRRTSPGCKPDGTRDDRRRNGTRTSRAAWACTSPAKRWTRLDERGRPVNDDELPACCSTRTTTRLRSRCPVSARAGGSSSSTPRATTGSSSMACSSRTERTRSRDAASRCCNRSPRAEPRETNSY